MALKYFFAGLLLLTEVAAAQKVPELRTEATNGGSIFYVKNSGPQAVTAFLIELVNYPGSYYSLWQDEDAKVLIAPGEELKIPVTNMTVGAVPDYVKLQAAVFADGSTAGVPEKVTQLVERRRIVLATIGELISRVGKPSTDKTELLSNLRKWGDSLSPAPKASRTSQLTINQIAAENVIQNTIRDLVSNQTDTVLAHLQARKRVLDSSKPTL